MPPLSQPKWLPLPPFPCSASAKAGAVINSAKPPAQINDLKIVICSPHIRRWMEVCQHSAIGGSAHVAKWSYHPADSPLRVAPRHSASSGKIVVAPAMDARGFVDALDLANGIARQNWPRYMRCMTKKSASDVFRIAVAQLNPMVGDIAGNLAKAREARADAARRAPTCCC